MTGKGKIARLPRGVRDQLNRRLDEGEAGKALVEWLNELPEVKEIMARQFGGRPINEQNLSEWKSREHREWLARQEALAHARELAADAQELSEATDGKLTDHLATVLAARYAAALGGWDGEVTEEFRRKLRALRGLCQDIVELRRGDHSGARLSMERERLQRESEKTEEEVVEHFKRWAMKPEVREWISRDWISPEEREQRIRDIFGLQAKVASQNGANDSDSNATDPNESNQIKPNQASVPREP